MAHFAKIENGIVTEVIVAEQDFIDEWHSDETWVQTSYNTLAGVHYGQDGEPDGGVALRGNFAGIGYIYDNVNDVFHISQPYASWILNQTTWIWESPIGSYPNNENIYYWDEEAYQADNSTGWKVLGD
tara:strand:+ start:38 stop:421 length:384 start_codon:yes stop_codon:yes gene_type:complete